MKTFLSEMKSLGIKPCDIFAGALFFGIIYGITTLTIISGG